MSSEPSLISTIKSSASSELFDDLDQLEGRKAIVWHSSILKIIDIFFKHAELEAHGVKSVSEPQTSDQLQSYASGVSHLVFVGTPTREWLARILKWLEVKLPSSTKLHVRVISRIPKSLHEFFTGDERAKIKGASLRSWALNWLPVFGDFVLNTMPAASTSQLLVGDDYELFFLCAYALSNNFAARRIIGRGTWAQQIIKNMRTLKPPPESLNCLYDELIIIDRLADPVTPLLEQFSFGGILEALVDIPMTGNIDVPEDYLLQKVPLAEADQKTRQKIRLSTDFYEQIIHLSLADAVAEIRKVLRELADIEGAHKELTSLNEYKQYMPSLKKLVSRKGMASESFRLCSVCYNYRAQPDQHEQAQRERALLLNTYTATTVIDFIEELICVSDGNEMAAMRALRLITLQSLVCGGLAAKVWNEYQKLLLQSYGPQAAAWCLNLQASGLVHVSGAQNRFGHIAADLKRLRTSIDMEQDPLAAFYNGYVPLLARLLDRGIKETWRGFELEEVERVRKSSVGYVQTSSVRRALFVVGGLTRAEIACLRAIEPGFTDILTTNYIKQNEFVDFGNVT